ncbi:MAG TPA: hypothetical protein PK981_03905 [Accumulibacter sp.]|nr:hypothetical protein [Accumulibacter sp.]HMW17812.1 hypothetical protein [Accumulibacter sp.]HND80296.1 hypothetical protein [Accumulibacter sp.]HNG38177.1 hypothetical protein [Accumulibacter sp.]HNH23994.1 hypothetical protein [Accumulibacter sp.]
MPLSNEWTGPMGHLIDDDQTIELYIWLGTNERLSGDGGIPAAKPLSSALSADKVKAVRNYFAEYHLEYFRQRQYSHFPSRLHACSLFATRTDAEMFGDRHPPSIDGKNLVQTRSQGPYLCSFHDASWLDYLHLPHSLSLAELDTIAAYYWQGVLVEQVAPRYAEQPWREPPVIEALFRGSLVKVGESPI